MSVSDCNDFFFFFPRIFRTASMDLIHTVKQSSKTLHSNVNKTKVLTSIKLHGHPGFEPQNCFPKP